MTNWALWACASIGLAIFPQIGATQESGAGASITWPIDFTDPAAKGNAHPAADLMLPLPCGAAMAFQRIETPLEVSDPLADRRVQLGQSEDASGFSDYLRPAFLRGPFQQDGQNTTHYYLARYELTRGQYRALTGDCAPPQMPVDRLAQTGLSWHEAIELSARLTTWLYENARDQMPTRGDRPGFLRLPTEAEWEYAVRGGAAVDPTVFPARHYFVEGSVADHAVIFTTGSGNGQIFPVGVRNPNPLGLFDVYGNAEEIMLEPFRLNALGRLHGQVGGVVTRGGSTFSSPDQVYSAARREYSPFDPTTGTPRRSDSFGVRLVISAEVADSDNRVEEIRRRWMDLAGNRARVVDPASDRSDPLARLGLLIDTELDPIRKRGLAELQLDLRRANSISDAAFAQSAKSTLLAGAAFLEAIETTAGNIEFQRQGVLTLVGMGATTSGNSMFRRQIDTLQARLSEARAVQCTYLSSYRSALEALTVDIETATRQRAYDILREELVLSERITLLATLDAFWADVSTFETSPDIDTLGLLELAMRSTPSAGLRSATRC
ncbi:MAG: SUMF1/EgtB/PvdO family nonheme iron enzyme [Pseudomonadota bacterium]